MNPKCPCCEKEIDCLEYKHDVSQSGTWDPISSYDVNIRDSYSRLKFICPKCHSDLFEEESDAKDFFRIGKDPDERDICSKIDDCHKIKIILDKDLLDFQYKEAIESVCDKCKKKE